MKIHVTEDFIERQSALAPLTALYLMMALFNPAFLLAAGVSIASASLLTKYESKVIEIDISPLAGIKRDTLLNHLRDELRFYRSQASGGLPAERRPEWKQIADMIEQALKQLEAA